MGAKANKLGSCDKQPCILLGLEFQYVLMCSDRDMMVNFDPDGEYMMERSSFS